VVYLEVPEKGVKRGNEREKTKRKNARVGKRMRRKGR